MMKGKTQSDRKTNSNHQIQNTMGTTFADKSIKRMKIPGLIELLTPYDDKEDTEGDDDKFYPTNTKHQIPVEEPLLEVQTT